MHGLRQIYLGHGNHFGHTRTYSYVTLAKWKLVLVRLEIVLISTHDRCMVCTEQEMAWKSFWAQPKVVLRDVGQVETRFDPFGDSFNHDSR